MDIAESDLLPDVDADTDGVAVTTAVTVLDRVTLGDTLGEAVRDADTDGEAALARDAETDFVADGVGDKFAVTLAEAERVRLVEGDCDVDGNGELDGDAVSATQSPAMIAATCACVSAYAKMRTLSRSPVKRLGKIVVPAPPTVSGVASRLTKLL